jgi:uracil-DNA glycosylase family 4
MTQEGFFSKTEVQSISRPDGKQLTCHSCGLYLNCKSPRMKVQGSGKKKILNVFEYPPFEDDKNGRMFQSKAGRLVTKTLKSLGVDVMEDCYNIHSLSCFPDNKYTVHSVDCCRRFVLQAIQDLKPSVIVLYGNLPLQSVIGHRWKLDLGGISKWRGWTIPDQDFGCWICPVFGADYVERSFGEFDKITAENTVWVNDLKQVVNLVV